MTIENLDKNKIWDPFQVNDSNWSIKDHLKDLRLAYSNWIIGKGVFRGRLRSYMFDRLSQLSSVRTRINIFQFKTS